MSVTMVAFKMVMGYMKMMLFSRTLEYVSGNSDKIYQVTVREELGEFITMGEYGRRGARLNQNEKYRGKDKNSALSIANKLADQKLKKGYSLLRKYDNNEARQTAAPQPPQKPKRARVKVANKEKPPEFFAF